MAYRVSSCIWICPTSKRTPHALRKIATNECGLHRRILLQKNNVGTGIRCHDDADLREAAISLDAANSQHGLYTYNSPVAGSGIPGSSRIMWITCKCKSMLITHTERCGPTGCHCAMRMRRMLHATIKAIPAAGRSPAVASTGMVQHMG